MPLQEIRQTRKFLSISVTMKCCKSLRVADISNQIPGKTSSCCNWQKTSIHFDVFLCNGCNLSSSRVHCRSLCSDTSRPDCRCMVDMVSLLFAKNLRDVNCQYELFNSFFFFSFLFWKSGYNGISSVLSGI